MRDLVELIAEEIDNSVDDWSLSIKIAENIIDIIERNGSKL